MALVIVQEKRKNPRFLISTTIHLSALDVLCYYAKRWKIEQMIKDLKHRLGFGDLLSGYPASRRFIPDRLFRFDGPQGLPVAWG